VKDRILESLRCGNGEESEGFDFVLCRAARSGENFPGHVHRSRDGKKVCCALSLGGVRDEAEIRGHRRTYIGALPGQIIQMMKKAATVNPILCWTKWTKCPRISAATRRAALMEVLDPEIESRVHGSLSGRGVRPFEGDVCVHGKRAAHNSAAFAGPHGILRLPGYTEKEKLEIAKRFLVKRALEATGLKEETLVSRMRACCTLSGTTRTKQECGTSNAKFRTLRGRWRAKVVSEKTALKAEITAENVNDFLGVLKYREFWLEKHNEIGLTTGLAWTEVGGSVLVTEAAIMEGKGRLTPTGKLGK